MVGALWLSLILSLLAMGMISMTQDGLLDVRTDEKTEKAWLLAESGVSMAKYNIARRQNGWVQGPEAYNYELGETKLDIYVLSPRGKPDINYASPALMRRLISGLGMTPDRAAILADRIADWRDEDDFKHLSGAEKNDYLAAGQAIGPGNRPFKDLGELDRVLDMSWREAACIRSFVTVWSGQAGLEPQAVTGRLREIFGMQELSEPAALNYRRSTLAGQVFEVVSDAPFSAKAKARYREIFRYTGIPADPVRTHHVERRIVKVDDTPMKSIPQVCPVSDLESGG